MALLELIMAGVGPFEETRLDFSDGHGKPHMGPHIIAGVNGSGKSTVLRAIAATVAAGPPSHTSGFQFPWWHHRLAGWRDSIAFTSWSVSGAPSILMRAIAPKVHQTPPPSLSTWAKGKIGPRSKSLHHLTSMAFGQPTQEAVFWCDPSGPNADGDLLATYAPSLALRDMTSNELAGGRASSQADSLAFGSTVSPATVQLWLQNLRFSISRMREQGQAPSGFEAVLSGLHSALTSIVGISVEIDVLPGIEPQLRVRLGGQSLNFSQLPDGARNLLGWLVDFVRRRETAPWSDELRNTKPSVLLVDEIDAHLHPRWQRTILPALAKAFEGQEVQIIVTTHSPFVISSCPGARVHVLDVDEKGHATARAPIDAPVGQSVNATMIDIFGVESRFDVQTERELNEWNNLRRKQAGSSLSPEEAQELQQLTERLAGKSEELRLLVGTGSKIPEEMLMSWFKG